MAACTQAPSPDCKQARVIQLNGWADTQAGHGFQNRKPGVRLEAAVRTGSEQEYQIQHYRQRDDTAWCIPHGLGVHPPAGPRSIRQLSQHNQDLVTLCSIV